MAAEGWFVRRGTNKQGPFGLAILRRAAAVNRIRRDDLVWTEGHADWVRADSIPDLFEAVATINPAAVSPPAAASRVTATDKTIPTTPRRTAGAPTLESKVPNYLVRHWRGDLSLPRTYWLDGISVAVASRLFLWAIGSVELSRGIAAKGFLVLAAFGVIYAASTWQLVGVWRSAGKHSARGGSPAWAIIARIVVVLAILLSLNDLITQAPIFKQAARMLNGHDQMPQFRLRVLRNATEVELSGGLSVGTTESLRALLDKTPTIKLIHLNNVGGWISEGRQLGALIEERHLSTFTSRECESACMLAFIAGKERYLGRNGRLGFHSASVGGVGGEVASVGTEEERAAFLRQGVDPAFVEHAVNTDPSDMWFPTQDELLSAHVITAVVDDRDFALTGLDAPGAESIDEQLAQVPVLVAIKNKEPTTYATIRADFIAGIQAGASQNELSATEHKLIAALLPKYLKTGVSEKLVPYWQTQISEMVAVRAVSAKECVRFLFPDTTSFAATSNLLSSDLRKADIQALADLIEAGPLMTAPTQAEIAPILARVMQSTEKQSPGATKKIANPDGAKSDATALCDAEIAFFQNVVELPISDAGDVLRWLSSQ